MNLFLILQLKQDNEEFRVMYREGPEGSPFHSLLVEGYVDGPLDVCKINWIHQNTWASCYNDELELGQIDEVIY